MGEIYRRAKRIVVELDVDREHEEHRQGRAYSQPLVKMLALTRRVLARC